MSGRVAAYRTAREAKAAAELPRVIQRHLKRELLYERGSSHPLRTLHRLVVATLNAQSARDAAETPALASRGSAIDASPPTFVDLNEIDHWHSRLRSPWVSPQVNFDQLLFREDHPSRAPRDTFTADGGSLLLRTHATAHLPSVLKGGFTAAAWAVDVYRNVSAIFASRHLLAKQSCRSAKV